MRARSYQGEPHDDDKPDYENSRAQWRAWLIIKQTTEQAWPYSDWIQLALPWLVDTKPTAKATVVIDLVAELKKRLAS